MIRGHYALLFAAACIALTAGAQESGELIPRRVFVHAVETEQLSSIPPEFHSMIRAIPFFLFSEINSLKPVLLSEDESEADSSLRVSVLQSEDGASVTCTVSDRGIVTSEALMRLKNDQALIESYARQIREIAEQFVPHMADVKPEVSLERIEQEERRSRIVKEATFAEALNRSFQLTVWAPGFTQLISFNEGRVDSSFNPPTPLHFSADLGYYPTENFGFLFSVYFDRNDRMQLGSVDELLTDDTSDDSYEVETIRYCNTENQYLLGGLGLGYRTLGRIGAEFNTILYLGILNLKAKEDIFHIYSSESGGEYDSVLALEKGEIVDFFYSMVSLQSILSFSITKRISLKAKWSLNVDPRILNPLWYTEPYRRGDALFMTLGELGLAVRF